MQSNYLQAKQHMAPYLRDIDDEDIPFGHISSSHRRAIDALCEFAGALDDDEFSRHSPVRDLCLAYASIYDHSLDKDASTQLIRTLDCALDRLCRLGMPAAHIPSCSLAIQKSSRSADLLEYIQEHLTNENAGHVLALARDLARSNFDAAKRTTLLALPRAVSQMGAQEASDLLSTELVFTEALRSEEDTSLRDAHSNILRALAQKAPFVAMDRAASISMMSGDQSKLGNHYAHLWEELASNVDASPSKELVQHTAAIFEASYEAAEHLSPQGYCNMIEDPALRMWQRACALLSETDPHAALDECLKALERAPLHQLKACAAHMIARSQAIFNLPKALAARLDKVSEILEIYEPGFPGERTRLTLSPQGSSLLSNDSQMTDRPRSRG